MIRDPSAHHWAARKLRVHWMETVMRSRDDYRSKPRHWLGVCAGARRRRLSGLCHCHNLSNAESNPETLQASGKGNIEIIEMDVTNGEQVKAVGERLKGKPLDLLINNAGSVEPVSTAAAPMKAKTILICVTTISTDGRSIEDQSAGPARVCGAFVDLAAGERPVAVNMGSTLSSIGPTWQAGRYAYRTSKAALNMLTRSAGEWYQNRHYPGVQIPAGLDAHRNGRPRRPPTRPKSRLRACAT